MSRLQAFQSRIKYSAFSSEDVLQSGPPSTMSVTTVFPSLTMASSIGLRSWICISHVELWNFAERKHTVVELVCGTLKCGRLRESLIISGAVEEVMRFHSHSASESVQVST